MKSCSHHPASIGNRTNPIKDDNEGRHCLAFFYLIPAAEVMFRPSSLYSGPSPLQK
jgi:hypothetical protein